MSLEYTSAQYNHPLLCVARVPMLSGRAGDQRYHPACRPDSSEKLLAMCLLPDLSQLRADMVELLNTSCGEN